MRRLSVLIVEDNRDIAENLMLYLEQCGYESDAIHSGYRAFELLQINKYDILLLDVMLPGMDGFTLAKKARNELHITSPILFVTARDAIEDKVEGFSFGGDDYITKPFDLREVELRLNALAKRSYGNVINKIEVENWRVELAQHHIFYEDSPVKLTGAAFTILSVLIQNHPNLVDRETIEQHLWKGDLPESDVLKSHMFALRKTIRKLTGKDYIETVHGAGFRFVLPSC